MRDEALEYINKIIVQEHGVELSEECLLKDSQIDSFGYALFWLEISDRYKLLENQESLSEKAQREKLNAYVNNIDYDTYKIKDLIDRIVQCM